ncbi:hypothetical protein GGR95_000356 [Sulfitobacter undariae]|uniref:MOSC domain-containing protein n=2 Tax=Sulfitobacter undariae TaxID=1563671 RepID=A0A7W6E0Z3_9RHOB|nr:hypothetical protein [Sulfitobacter undariae]
MPYDRLWAIAHEATKADGTEWAACQNFGRVAKTPALAAISTTLDERTETITLHHPDQPDLTVQPDTEKSRLINWITPLCDASRAQPTDVFRLEGRGFTDSPFASVSLCNVASQTALEEIAQAPLQSERWRGNFWFDGAAAWDEFDWVGREMRLGTALLKIEAPIRRCMATAANPQTGLRDVDTLKALNTLGHQDFGIYASIIKSGDVACGDQLELV